MLYCSTATVLPVYKLNLTGPAYKLAGSLILNTVRCLVKFPNLVTVYLYVDKDCTVAAKWPHNIFTVKIDASVMVAVRIK